MKAKAAIISIALLFVTSFVTSIANASDVGGPPKPDEVIGYWKMVPIDKPGLNKVNPWPMPYQWFAFYPDGHLVSMGKTENAKYDRKQLEAIFKSVKDSAPKYSWRQNFILVEYPNAPGKSEIWGMNLLRKDAGFMKAGDLIMSLAGDKDGAPVYYRLLEPVK